MATTSHLNAESLPTDTAELFETAVQRATALLRSGQVVALPTETVYGLAANALEGEAVAKIFEIKGRPAHNPIIVHVASLEMARQCMADWPALAERLAQAFWPGPLTLVLPRANHIPDVLTAGGPTVGVRWPSHPFIQEVIRRCGFPLAAPSANLSNQVSPTKAAHVLKQLGHKISLVIDGGQCQVGIESTVLDLSSSPPRVLRPGMIQDEALIAVTGELANGCAPGTEQLKSPGLLQKHYSPRARLVVSTWRNDAQLRERVGLSGIAPCKTHIITHTCIPSVRDFGGVHVIPHDVEAFARAIYAQLHQCDDAGAELVVIESLPQRDEWRAVTDRLTRASTRQQHRACCKVSPLSSNPKAETNPKTEIRKN